MDETLAAVFTQIDAPGRMPGVRWLAELVDSGFNPCPVPMAVAWLTDFRGSPHFDCVVLDYMLVPDHYRRKGYATRLIRECESRWPVLVLTDAISDAGEGLLASLDAGTGES